MPLFTIGGGHPEGEGTELKIGPSPRPSTSAHRPADYKSAIPSLCVFHPIWVYLGVGGGLPRGLGHISPLGSSKMEISEPGFFDLLIIQNDQISCAKHVLAPLYVYFPHLGGFFCGGGVQGLGHHLLMQLSSTAWISWFSGAGKVVRHGSTPGTPPSTP